MIRRIGSPNHNPAFGQVFGFWLKDQRRGELVFAKATGQPRRFIRSGAILDIKVLLGHKSIATTQIYTNVGQGWMEQVVARL